MNAGHVGNEGAAADVDEDPRRRQLVVADPNRVRPFEPGVSLEDRALLHASQKFLHARSRVGDHGVGARLDLGHIDPDVAADHDPVVGGPAGEMRRVRAGDERLGRHTPGVDAGAAEQLALHERDRHSGSGQPSGQ